MKRYKQIQVKVTNNNTAKVYLVLPHFKYPKLLGALYRNTKTFRTIKRSFGNLFHLFGWSGLGINEEILNRLNFDFIEIPYNNEILKTTRLHFVKNAVPSPFISDKVDKQMILKISDFITPTAKAKEKQEDMFEVNHV